MRMCLESASRQPCSAGSCIAVTRNLLSGLNTTAEMRARPFQKFGHSPPCWETTASRRYNARSQAADPLAQRRARRRSRVLRTIFLHALPLRTKAVLPADHAKAPSGCSATLSIQRRFGSSREQRDFAVGIERNKLAVVAAHDETLAIGRRAQECRRHARQRARSRPARSPGKHFPRRRRRPRCRRENAPP